MRTCTKEQIDGPYGMANPGFYGTFEVFRSIAGEFLRDRNRRKFNENSHLRKLQVAVCDGGGGNRTRVSAYFHAGFYVCSSPFKGSSDQAPMSRIRHGLTGSEFNQDLHRCPVFGEPELATETENSRAKIPGFRATV